MTHTTTNTAKPTEPETTRVDLVVSGAGATGWSFLLALEQHLAEDARVSVVLVDTFDDSKPMPHPGFDARALALSQQSLQFFRELQLGDDVSVVTTPIHKIHVSDQGSAGQVQLHHQDYGLAELGVVVEAQALGKMLLETAQRRLFSSQSKIQLTHIQPAQIQQIITRRDSINLTLSDGQQFQSQLLVLAEGSHSASRELLKLEAEVQQYGQHAIITNVVTEKPHSNIAWERFTASGPVAFLPMSAQRSGVVWSVNSEHVETILELGSEDFKARLQDAFGYRLGAIVKTGKTQSYPLQLIRVDDSLAHRVACIGNASQTLHPIAGQGFNLAFRDAWQLAQSVAQQCGNNADVGEFRALSAWKKRRQQDRDSTIFFTDGLVRLFSNENPLLQGARNAGLMAMQCTPALKQQFARMAMGQNKIPQSG